MKTKQEILDKFNEIVAHYAKDPENTRTSKRPGDRHDRYVVDPQGRTDPEVFFTSIEDAQILENYISWRVVVDPAQVKKIWERKNSDWSMAIVLAACVLHDCDECWMTEGLSDLGQSLVDSIHRIIELDRIPDTETFRGECSHFLKNPDCNKDFINYFAKLGTL